MRYTSKRPQTGCQCETARCLSRLSVIDPSCSPQLSVSVLESRTVLLGEKKKGDKRDTGSSQRDSRSHR